MSASILLPQPAPATPVDVVEIILKKFRLSIRPLFPDRSSSLVMARKASVWRGFAG